MNETPEEKPAEKKPKREYSTVEALLALTFRYLERRRRLVFVISENQHTELVLSTKARGLLDSATSIAQELLRRKALRDRDGHGEIVTNGMEEALKNFLLETQSFRNDHEDHKKKVEKEKQEARHEYQGQVTGN